jgi:hypothetical protein
MAEQIMQVARDAKPLLRHRRPGQVSPGPA